MTMKSLEVVTKLALPLCSGALAALLAAACTGVDGGAQQSSDVTEQQCIPECAQIGTEKEGWYCGNKQHGPLGPCSGCEAYCGAVGTRSEGWYSSCDDSLIGWDLCADIEPEPEPSCLPSCEQTGTADEGWYCNEELRGAPRACDGCVAYCSAIGSKSEGWYSSCGGLIGWDACSKREMDPACVPTCIEFGDDESGWYCDGKIVGPAGDCTGCMAGCDAIGTRSEGWYSSCGGLIAWANCG
jgi:hypothetical protein